MLRRCVPMMHVPDVRATIAWYEQVGFEVVETYSEGSEGLSFAVMKFGETHVMFNAGGRRGAGARRDADLYVYSDGIDAFHDRLVNSLDVIEPPHDTFYGQREVIVRDPNGFHVTFGEPSAGAVLMWGIEQRHIEAVRSALGRRGLTQERLNLAFTAARAADPPAAEIVALLREAGAIEAPHVSRELLASYAGTYRSDDGRQVSIVLQGGTLLAFPDDAPGVSLLPTDARTFTCGELDNAVVQFEVDDQRPTALRFSQGPLDLRFARVEEGLT